MELSIPTKIAYFIILMVMLICSYYLLTLPRELEVSEEYRGMIYVDEQSLFIPKYERVFVQCELNGRKIIYLNKSNLKEVKND